MELTPEQREREKAFIDNPLRWPLLRLPVKNRQERGEHGFPKLGRITCGMSWDTDERTVYIGSMYDPITEDTERVTYPSTDALLDAGWVID